MRIAVFCPNWVGDVVMATPTLRALRKHFPNAHIAGVMRPYVAETLAGNPWLDEVIYHDHKSADSSQHLWSVARRLRRDGYDIAALLTNSFRSGLIAYLGNVKRRTGYARDLRRFLLNDPLKVTRGWEGYRPSPVIDYYLSVAYHLGAPTEAYAMELFTSADDERAADAIWDKFGFAKSDSVVVLNPGAAFGSAKRWPSQYFADLAMRLVDEQGAKAIILCGPNERGYARFIADASMRPRQVKCLADEKVSLGLSKAIVKRSALLVSTDSGPRHFGAAFGVPVVSLFGPTHIEWTDTYYPLETKMQKKLPCGPCQQRVCPLGHLKCMTDLTADEVYAEAVARLSRYRRQAV